MQCVILAAGYGSRMGKLTECTPKPMLRVKERPLLEYKVHILPPEITEVVFVVGHMCHHVMNYFGSYYAGRPVRYAFQSALRGTADALHTARPFLGERFMVLMGDDFYTRVDLHGMVGNRLAILGYHSNDVQGKGVIIADEDQNLSAVRENVQDAQSGLINAAAYMLTQDFFDYAPVSAGNNHVQEVGLPQTLAQMTDRHEVVIHRATAWLPITTPADLEIAQEQVSVFL